MRRSLLLLAVVAATSGGCSGGSGEADGRSPSAAALERAFHEFQGAYLDGDGERAYGLISDHCRGVTSQSDMVGLADEYAAFMEGQDARPTIVGIDRRPSDAVHATVMYNLGDPEEGSLPDKWVVEDGEWRHDSC